MGEVHGGLIMKGTVNVDTEIPPPTATGEARVHRNKAADGAGIYYGKLNTGVEEVIGGPGTGAGTQLSVEVTYDEVTRVATSIVTGGTAATYAWTMKSGTTVAAEAEATFAGAVNGPTATLTAAGGATTVGMPTVKVTDTLGRIAFGYFAVRMAAGA